MSCSGPLQMCQQALAARQAAGPGASGQLLIVLESTLDLGGQVVLQGCASSQAVDDLRGLCGAVGGMRDWAAAEAEAAGVCARMPVRHVAALLWHRWHAALQS